MRKIKSQDRRTTIKRSYFKNFIILIVVPIICIIVVALSIMRLMMRESAISNIQNIQSSLVEMLNRDIDEESLQLSHYIHTNDNQLLEIAAKTDTEDIQERYANMVLLKEIFQTTSVSDSGVIALGVYMKSGISSHLRETILMPYEEMKEMQWYQNALENKDVITVSSYDTSKGGLVGSYIGNNELLLILAVSPSEKLNKTEEIEMVVLIYKTNVGRYIREYNKNELLGETLLVDCDGHILYGSNDINFQERSYKYNVIDSEIPSTKWKLINYVETSKLTYHYNQFMIWILVVLFILFFLFYLYSNFFLKQIINPVQSLVVAFQKMERGVLDIQMKEEGQSEIRDMMKSFNQMVQRLNETIEEKNEAQNQMYRAEFQALQSQINPHFLVNTLSSMRFMAQISKSQSLQKMADALIQILSSSFRNNDSFYTIEEEMKVLDGFIYLMKIRYSESFDVEYKIDENCYKIKMPRLMLQPVVENSIIHGFVQMDEERGMIQISVYQNNHCICFEVLDNGQGIAADEINEIWNNEYERKVDNYHIGLDNINNRLKLYYGEQYKVGINSKVGEYTKVTIMLPIEVDQEE